MARTEQEAESQLKTMVRYARRHGLSEAEVRQIVERALNDSRGDKTLDEFLDE